MTHAERILEILRQGPRTADAIAGMLGASRHVIDVTIRRLARNEMVHSTIRRDGRKNVATWHIGSVIRQEPVVHAAPKPKSVQRDPLVAALFGETGMASKGCPP